MSDCTAIWFAQYLGTGEIRIIDYYENSGEGLAHYAEVLRNKGYHYGQHIAPHDIQVKELGNGKSRIEKARELGIRFDVAPSLSVMEGIDEVRMILPRCWFDKENCSEGLKALEAYQKEWNDKAGTWRDRPKHDWTSHGSDAFRYLAVGHRPPAPKRRGRVKSDYNMFAR
ncbi:terminase family protein [Aduncisulcus paluster]|uniref:Terminase family protein n=1 Tax=Aduncisulcus paluster TaxID=2918883 RepID=A0ABQ5K994_9EUKA|nr:terminase family protein [Aduncisulcus paluster]